MARQLAWALDGLYVAEVARSYLTARAGQYTAKDLPLIWAAQKEAMLEAVATGASFVVCDTGPEVISIWEEVKYGQVSPAVSQGFQEQHYALTLLCNPDLPWEPDPLREAPEQAAREHLLLRYRQLLVNRDYHEVRGPGRLAQALRLVAAFC